MRDKTKVAYRCPYCGSVISIDISDRMLQNGFKFECMECKKSFFETKYSSDGSVNFLVPCLMCPHPHPYKVSKDMFFNRDIYCLSCSFTGLDICFFGDDELVEDEIDRTSAEISELMLMTKDDQEGKKSADMMVADTSVMREVLFAIGNLETDKKIKCHCGSKSIKAIVDYDKVKIVCKVCSSEQVIPARNKFDANNAIELENIDILAN
jgi:hypothetical protein